MLFHNIILDVLVNPLPTILVVLMIKKLVKIQFEQTTAPCPHFMGMEIIKRLLIPNLETTF